MPEWNTTERGVTRESETRSWGDEQGDYDGLSCMYVEGWWPNGGHGVEDTTMLHGLGLQAMDEDDHND